MKTSNKLISLGIAILILSVAVFIMAAKTELVPRDKKMDDNDIINELAAKELLKSSEIIQRDLGKLLSNKLDLDGNHRYILDPDSDDVIVTGKSEYVNRFKPLTDSTLFDAVIYHDVTSKRDERNDSKVYDRITDTLYYKIGVKGKQDLLVLIGNESKVTISSALNISSLKVIMEGASHIDGELNCDKLELTTHSAGYARLKGTATNSIITAYENSRLECGELVSGNAEIMLSGNSRLSLKANNALSGMIRNNAFYNNHGFVSGENVLVMDNGRFD